MATFTAVAAPSLVTSLTAAHRRRRPAGVRAATALSDNRERHGADEGAKTTKRAAKATTTRRDLFVSGGAASFASLAALAASPPAAFAEFTEDKEYMSSLAGKDYGKSRYNYPDFVQTKSGLQYKDMVQGTGAEFTAGKKAVIDWDGYTLGYYGRPFEARNKSKGGAFTGDDKEFIRFTVDDAKIIPAFREAIVGMKVGAIRRVIVAGGSDMGYPPGRKWKQAGPQPSNFSGQRALGFVLENEGMIDKTLLFDIELIRIDDVPK
eukprot:CAMPEP_0181365678 /NCGR_PEP_ID=MMETSP1106-20121128/10221_1 /TAXON_ID=81844 /ORGANISM="Mantoniella antarctica, Strain SL-175" /LENGTH=263 /DNA_ID=CAMNT_0023480821 /DNA_START=45 /DNA_END=836 /DNA_ORIENTATION=-